MDTIAVGLPGEAEPVTERTEPILAKPRTGRFRTALYAGVALVGLGLMGYAFLPQSPQPAPQNSVTLPTPKPIPGASGLSAQEPPPKAEHRYDATKFPPRRDKRAGSAA